MTEQAATLGTTEQAGGQTDKDKTNSEGADVVVNKMEPWMDECGTGGVLGERESRKALGT